LLLKPQPLRLGDSVAVVAPGGAYDAERLERGCRLLETWGLSVTRPRARPTVRYLAGSDESRAGELREALDTRAVRAVLVARGGVGATRLFGHLRLRPAPEEPKLFVGFSDTTVLLTRLVQEATWVSFHGPMIAADLPDLSAAAQERFRRFLFDEAGWWSGEATACWRAWRGSGRLIGGCLTILVATLGTPYEVYTDEQVLFLEDVNEKPYRVERMLVQLRDAGKFERASAIVFGAMPGCDEGGGPEVLRGIVLDVLAPYRCPILFGVRAGHASENVVLPFGCRVSVCGEDVAMTLDESPFSRRG
jgi:muramoyltetrapeptide carboxypeptidase